MLKRRRFKQVLSLNERLEQQAARLRAQAEKLPPGRDREKVSRKARQTETATHVDEWISSPRPAAAAVSVDARDDDYLAESPKQT